MFKNEYLVELIEALSVCHESSVNSQGKVVSIRSDERAVLDLCTKLGLTFELKSTGSNNSKLFYKILTLKINKKPYKKLNIVGINSYSNRGRMSMVVNDPSQGGDNFTLYCKGSEYAMRPFLKFSSQERNNLKRLIVKMRSSGVKTLIFAKRSLTP